MNPASAAACRQCGAAFDATAVVPAPHPETRCCPQCSLELPRLVETCLCGHVFRDVRELRERLEAHVRLGWSRIALGVLSIVGVTAFVVMTASGVLAWLWFGGCALLARGIVTRRHAKAGLAELRGARGELPQATLVRE
jgi:hypothetical protein